MFADFFKDKQGNIVIAQTPNLPILTWAAATIVEIVITDAAIEKLFSLIAFGALFTWAWLELFSGVCAFRRVLGGVVMLGLLISSL